jgi:putative addiction module antidote
MMRQIGAFFANGPRYNLCYTSDRAGSQGNHSEAAAVATTTKIIAIGNSVGVILPKETLARLNVQKGDTICISETPYGAHLTPYDEEFARKLEASKRVMHKYRDALRKLAE